MLEDVQRRMIGHGAAILLVAMVSGIGLLISLIGGVEILPGRLVPFDVPSDPTTWARVHIGGLLNALLVLAVAAVLPVLHFPHRSASGIAWALIGTAWANTLFYWAALFAPNRALTLGPNRFGETNLAAWLGLPPALVFAVISMVAVATIAWRALTVRS